MKVLTNQIVELRVIIQGGKVTSIYQHRLAKMLDVHEVDLLEKTVKELQS